MSRLAPVGLSNPGSASETIITDGFLPGRRSQIQRYQGNVGENLEEANDRHLIVQMRDSAWAERRGASGCWAPFLKERGSLTIVPSGPVPEVRLLAPSNMILCVLEKGFTGEIALEMDRCPANDTDFHIRDTSIEALINLLVNESEAFHPCALYSQTLEHALAMRFLLRGSSSVHGLKSSIGALPPRILRRIRDRIEAGVDTELSLASLAKESGYSRAHFLRMFRAATGLTPHQYVLERRLSAAQHLLRQPTMLLADIALKAGFSSQTHMNDVFRKRLGVTPLQYRRDI